MTEKCSWPLGNGQSLDFGVYSRNEGWNDVPGLYIFAYQSGDYWRALYVGQAQSFQARLPNHERLNEAVQNGATHVHALIVQQQAKRDQLEQILIRHLQPPMNVQHRQSAFYS